jgi:FkbM family methyltransferase
MFASLRRIVEAVPFASVLYRAVRDQYSVARLRAQPTTLGVLFGGHPGMASGAFEPEETAFLQESLKGADVFVDVGANLGLYACLARKAGKQVVAVEPLPENVAGLLLNLHANGFDDVEVFPLGLAERPGLVTLFGGGTGASLLPGWSGASTQYRRLVSVSTLDLLIGRRFEKKRLLIKIDVEGVELSVLKGAIGTLKRQPRPLWMVEVCLTEHHPGGRHPEFLDVFDMFWNEGYAVREIGGSQVLERSEMVEVLRSGKKPRTHNYIFSSPE